MLHGLDFLFCLVEMHIVVAFAAAAVANCI